MLPIGGGLDLTIPKRWRQGAVLVTAVAMLAYLGISTLYDGGRILAATQRVGIESIGLVLLLSLVNYALRFWRWQIYSRWNHIEVPFWRSLAIYFSAFAMTISPGRAGEAVRSLYLKSEGVSYSASLAMLFGERLTDLLAIGALATLILLARSDLEWTIFYLFLACVITLGVFAHPSIPDYLRRWAGRRTGKMAGWADWLAKLFDSVRPLLHWRRLAPLFVLSVVAWSAEGYGLFVFTHALGASVTVSVALGIYSLAILAGAAAFFMPGGLGGTEAVLVAMLVSSGMDVAEAVAATLLIRLATLWFAVLIGAAAMIGYEIAWPARGEESLS